MVKYIPKQGDIIYLDFSQTIEEKGKRSALVISNEIYNKFTNLTIVCPITSVIRDYPFHIVLPNNLKTKGVVMGEQLKAIDYEKRNVRFFEKIDKSTLDNILDVIMGFYEDTSDE